MCTYIFVYTTTPPRQPRPVPEQFVFKDRKCRCSSAPAGQSAAVEGDAAPLWQFPPHRFLTWFLAAARRYLGSLLSLRWLPSTHTPREGSLLFFVSTLRHTFCLIPTSAIPLSFTLTFLKCAFELAAVCVSERVCVCACAHCTLMFVSKMFPEDFFF